MGITLVGLGYMAKNLNGVDSNAFVYMATGTGATAFATSDTALENENSASGAGRKAATCTFISPGTARWNALFSFTGDVTVREIGLFDSENNLLYRRVLAENEIYHDGGAMEYTVDITFSVV